MRNFHRRRYRRAESDARATRARQLRHGGRRLQARRRWDGNRVAHSRAILVLLVVGGVSWRRGRERGRGASLRAEVGRARCQDCHRLLEALALGSHGLQVANERIDVHRLLGCQSTLQRRGIRGQSGDIVEQILPGRALLVRLLVGLRLVDGDRRIQAALLGRDAARLERLRREERLAGSRLQRVRERGQEGEERGGRHGDARESIDHLAANLHRRRRPRARARARVGQGQGQGQGMRQGLPSDRWLPPEI